MDRHVVCTNCGQDWVTRFVVISTGRTFFMCPNCEWIWLRRDDPLGPPPKDISLDRILADTGPGENWDKIRRLED